LLDSRAAPKPLTERLCLACLRLPAAIGISGSRQTIFAAEVDDAMAAAAGGGGLRDHGEAIEVGSGTAGSQHELQVAKGCLAAAPAPLPEGSIS
jgi:hypothetical protein